MVQGLLGRKRGMSQIFEPDSGRVVPVTVLEVGPCVVLQVKTADSPDGYGAVQLGFEDQRAALVRKPQQGRFAKLGVAAKRVVREVRPAPGKTVDVGAVVGVGDVFSVGAYVDVRGVSKGRGFAGPHKRHGFHFQPRTHGGMAHRWHGSIGMHTDPGRVLKGKRMAGHHGAARVTTKNLRVVEVDAARNLLVIRGAIPGFNGGAVLVSQARTPRARARGKTA